MMDSFVVYHTWKFIGAAEFAVAHQQSGGRIVSIFVLPTAVATLLLILMFWHRHVAITRTQLWICLTCMLIPWVSSALIQIPMQMELSKGRNEVLLHQLITTDWIRVIPSWFMVIVVAKMMFRVMR
jgi:hypothetical protein